MLELASHCQPYVIKVLGRRRGSTSNPLRVCHLMRLMQNLDFFHWNQSLVAEAVPTPSLGYLPDPLRKPTSRILAAQPCLGLRPRTTTSLREPPSSKKAFFGKNVLGGSSTFLLPVQLGQARSTDCAILAGCRLSNSFIFRWVPQGISDLAETFVRAVGRSSDIFSGSKTPPAGQGSRLVVFESHVLRFWFKTSGMSQPNIWGTKRVIQGFLRCFV